jgi:hypothetical protein
MSNALWDLLEEHAGSGVLEKLSAPLQQKLRRLSEALAVILSNSDPAATAEILSRLSVEVLGHLTELEVAAQEANAGMSNAARPGDTQGKDSLSGAIAPEIVQWARQELNEEETVAGLREVRETGGLELCDFIQELEQEVTPRE